MNIEKFISYQVESQFPDLYKEEGQDFVQLLKAYYEYMETDTSAPVYKGRRIFEYRDIDSTPSRMLLFFKKKYLADMPFNGEDTRFIVKHILDLYRRRGTPEGIDLFFRLFYQEDASVFYPAINILKPSSSKWENGIFLEMIPSDNLSLFQTVTGRFVTGSLSGAETSVIRSLFIFRNGSVVPVLFIEKPRGNFIPQDDILVLEQDGSITNIGRVYGSVETITVLQSGARSNSQIGDILDVISTTGSGARAFVTEINTESSGQIFYEIEDGGSVYSIENTALYVSNQTLETPSTPPVLTPRERVSDQFGNSGMFIGARNNFLGFRMDSGDAFVPTSIIQTTGRVVNISIPFVNLFAKNESSPGPIRPEVAPIDIPESVQVGELSNTSSLTINTDILNNFTNVLLNASNYNLSPALAPMSGAAISPNRNTVLTSAFATDTFTVGTIENFINLNPGQDYITEVFAIAVDLVVDAARMPPQIIELETSGSAFAVGGIITQGGRIARIEEISGNLLYVAPSNFQIFTTADITYNGNVYGVNSVEFDYRVNAQSSGNNATIFADTDFGSGGRVQTVTLIDSGFGYSDNELVTLEKDGEFASRARIVLGGQGITEGFWSTFDSHLNSEKVIQDSDYYQEFSYEVSTGLPINTYEDQLKSLVHVAGTKFFGKFVFRDEVNIESDSDILIITQPSVG